MTRTLRSVALLMLLPLLATGCAIFGTSKAERMMRLEYDLNGGLESRKYAYQNFDPGSTVDYNDLASWPPSQTWDDWFPLEPVDTVKYSFEVQDVSPDSVRVRVTGPASFGGPRTLKAGMVRVGLEWYINSLELSGAVPPLIVD